MRTRASYIYTLIRSVKVIELEDIIDALFSTKALKRSLKILIPITFEKVLRSEGRLYNIRNAVEKIACIDNCKRIWSEYTYNE